MSKCWFWKHQWGDWVKDRVEHWSAVYLRKRRDRTYFIRTCTLCGHTQEKFEDDVWWEL